jgi:hypothetical protein
LSPRVEMAAASSDLPHSNSRARPLAWLSLFWALSQRIRQFSCVQASIPVLTLTEAIAPQGSQRHRTPCRANPMIQRAGLRPPSLVSDPSLVRTVASASASPTTDIATTSQAQPPSPALPTWSTTAEKPALGPRARHDSSHHGARCRCSRYQ